MKIKVNVMDYSEYAKEHGSGELYPVPEIEREAFISDFFGPLKQEQQ